MCLQGGGVRPTTMDDPNIVASTSGTVRPETRDRSCTVRTNGHSRDGGIAKRDHAGPPLSALCGREGSKIAGSPQKGFAGRPPVWSRSNISARPPFDLCSPTCSLPHSSGPERNGPSLAYCRPLPAYRPSGTPRVGSRETDHCCSARPRCHAHLTGPGSAHKEMEVTTNTTSEPRSDSQCR